MPPASLEPVPAAARAISEAPFRTKRRHCSLVRMRQALVVPLVTNLHTGRWLHAFKTRAMLVARLARLVSQKLRLLTL